MCKQHLHIKNKIARRPVIVLSVFKPIPLYYLVCSAPSLIAAINTSSLMSFSDLNLMQ